MTVGGRDGDVCDFARMTSVGYLRAHASVADVVDEISRRVTFNLIDLEQIGPSSVRCWMDSGDVAARNDAIVSADGVVALPGEQRSTSLA